MERRTHRDESQSEIYSALYIDFDNIYTRLKEQDTQAAEAFATHPQRWLKWLEHHAVRTLYGRNVRRRILKRTCYLNPHWYDRFRPFFIRSAFTVVDCPPLTNQGKTSADIKLVMDTLDALAHRTHFDEFMILSGDADFTPLLIRLQEHARNTLVLCVGFSSPAYTAASTWRIREDWFMQQALAEYDNRRRPPSHQQADNGGRNENLRQGALLIRDLVRQSDAPLSLTHLSNTVQ